MVFQSKKQGKKPVDCFWNFSHCGDRGRYEHEPTWFWALMTMDRKDRHSAGLTLTLSPLTSCGGWSQNPLRPANSHSFRLRPKQWPHPISGFRVRKLPQLQPASCILSLIEYNFGKISPLLFSNLTQLTHLGPIRGWQVWLSPWWILANPPLPWAGLTVRSTKE